MVAFWWLDDWLILYPPQVKHLWFQQKQTREATVVTTEALLKGGNCFCSWPLRGNRLKGKSLDIMPHLPTTPVRIAWCLSWQGGTKLALLSWQPVIAFPMASHPAKMEEPQTSVSLQLGLMQCGVLMVDGWMTG